jgi:GNAT superfamily N-acetyltransferase
VTSSYRPPRLIAAADNVEEFRCTSSEQTQWLRRFAKQSSSTSTTRVFVVTQDGHSTVVAYYAWCMAQLDLAAAPDRLKKGAGRYPQPMALLARLGVDAGHEGKGLGAALLADAVGRLLTLSEDIGCRGLLIHAESAVVRDFYLHLIPELEQSSTDELHLVLLLKDARRTLLSE